MRGWLKETIPAFFIVYYVSKQEHLFSFGTIQPLKKIIIWTAINLL